MDLHKIISELQSEKQRLDEAIQALERLSTTASKTKRPSRLVNSKASEEQPQAKAHGSS